MIIDRELVVLLTKPSMFGKLCYQNNQLPTKSHDKLEKTIMPLICLPNPQQHMTSFNLGSSTRGHGFSFSLALVSFIAPNV
jgi:hypothetical protein